MIIVTGALGFIGSNLLYELEHNGYDHIIAFDWFGREDKWKNVAKRSNVLYLTPEKIIDFINVHKTEIEAIIHLGAISSTTETDGDLIMSNNYELSISLFEFAKGNDIQFIYASSAATYGDGSNGFDDQETLEYLSLLRPLNLYGWSKNQFDLYVARTNGYTNGSQTVALKFFNVYGPNEYHKGSQKSVINGFYEQAVKQGEIKLFQSNVDNIKDGEQSRDFIYVNDCVNVILWFLNNPELSGIYNVGTGKATTFNEVAFAVKSHTHEDVVISYIPMPDNISHQYQNYTCANISKLRASGYQAPMISINEGVSIYLNEFLTQQDKFK